MSKTKDLMQMDDAQLDAKIAELKTELMKDNAQAATGTTPKSPSKIRNAKQRS